MMPVRNGEKYLSAASESVLKKLSYFESIIWEGASTNGTRGTIRQYAAFPLRVKCATLPRHAFEAALKHLAA